MKEMSFLSTRQARRTARASSGVIPGADPPPSRGSSTDGKTSEVEVKHVKSLFFFSNGISRRTCQIFDMEGEKISEPPDQTEVAVHASV